MDDRHEQFVEKLLNQLPQLSSEQYVKYRKELDHKLAAAQRDEKTTRWIVAGAWIGAVAFFAGTQWLSVLVLRNPGHRLPDWIVLPLVAAAILMPVGGLLLLALYLFKYRRRSVRARLAAQDAALAELQRQLNELRSKLLPSQENESGRPPSP